MSIFNFPGEPPQRLDNGATVHYWNLTHSGGDGHRRHGVALCNWQHGIGEWVTWTLYRDEDGRWHAEQGHYFENVVEAVEDFKQRAGITSWEGMTS